MLPQVGGLIGTETHPLEQYIYWSGASTPADLPMQTPQFAGSLVRTTWVIQTFDLTTMGIAPGVSISTLYLQDWSGWGNPVYPTFLAGFPAVPEPSAMALSDSALLALLLVARRKTTRSYRAEFRRSRPADTGLRSGITSSVPGCR